MKVHSRKDARHERLSRSNQTVVGTNDPHSRASAGTRAFTHSTIDFSKPRLLFRVVSFFLALVLVLPAGTMGVGADPISECVANLPVPTPVHAVHVQPGAGPAPILDEINSAHCSIDISMYMFTSAEIVSGLQYANQRGVRVRVILEPDPFGAWGTQQDIFDELVAIGAEVQWSPTRFEYLHAKYMIVDDSVLVVTNQNFTGAGFNNNREFGVVTTEKEYVAEAVQIFASDWNVTNGPDGFDHLVVSPTNARQSILQLINSSESSVWMYAEVLRDEEVTAALDNAILRGVDVRLLVNPTASDEDAPYFLDAMDHGVQVRILENPYVHSKALIVDNNRVLVGSQNYSYTSLDLNREIGMVLTDSQSLEIVTSVFESDWVRAVPVDSISLGGENGEYRLKSPGRIGKLICGRWGVV